MPSDGSITSQPDGGTPGYFYSWSPTGGNTSIANNLSSGKYFLTVTDANGCQAQFSVDVNEPDKIIASSEPNVFFSSSFSVWKIVAKNNPRSIDPLLNNILSSWL